MIQELSDRVWNTPAFHDDAQKVELEWLRKELSYIGDIPRDSPDPEKLMRAAAILACSNNQIHRRAAFRVATCTYELFGTSKLPLDQALRVVLSRLGNHPSISTRTEVENAISMLPFSLATEEILATEKLTVFANNKPISLTDFQFKLWSQLEQGKRISLTAPTSAGKSFVLEHYLSAIFSSHDKKVVIYIVPTRALIAQVADDLNTQFKKFSDSKPDIVSIPVDSETEIKPWAIYVMTQERVQLMLSTHPDMVADVIIIDEAHSIADGSRGMLLQWVIDDLLARNPNAQTLFASPSIRNLGVFGRLFGINDIEELSSAEPTVSQNFLVVKIESAATGKISISTTGDGSKPLTEIGAFQLNQTLASRVDRLVHIAATLGKRQSNIVYANGPADAEKIAIQLAELFSDREPTKAQKDLSELAKEVVHPNYVLAECIKHGVAFHYSNIPTQLRRAIEEATSLGEVSFLVCTSTLLQGVNLPAKNIFMLAPERGHKTPLESTDFWNLAGRAGRLKKEFQGNIFLIDYDHWKKKPLDSPKDTEIVPAIENSIRNNQAELLAVISERELPKPSKPNDETLETAFVRLYSDQAQGRLGKTLERMGFEGSTPTGTLLSIALSGAATRITLPEEILRKTPNVSAYKQQNLFNHLQLAFRADIGAAKKSIPLHPRDRDAFLSYANILEICHQLILKIDTTKNLHRFHALIAQRWMQGTPLPQIIDNQIKRSPNKIVRTTIRDTLKLIEEQIRFQTVRLFGCYNSILSHALKDAGLEDLTSSIPSLPVFLEVGASDRTMISFISLGLSRVTAMKLNELSARKDLDTNAALNWLRNRPLATMGLSPMLLAEVQAIVEQ